MLTNVMYLNDKGKEIRMISTNGSNS